MTSVSELKNLPVTDLVIHYKKTQEAQALNLIIKKNVGIINSTINKMGLSFSSSYEDFLQEGRLAVLQAIKKFDPDKGYKFSTYAVWWVRQYVRLYDQNMINPVYVPHRHKNIDNMFIVKNLRERTFSTDHVQKGTKNSPFSLENYTEDFCTGKSFLSPEEEYEYKEKVKTIKNIVSSALTGKEKMVFNHRNGLAKGGRKTLRQVADIFGVSRERIRQIEKVATKKVKDMMVLEGIHD
jgi:RNA polymerase primary sigma factor